MATAGERDAILYLCRPGELQGSAGPWRRRAIAAFLRSQPHHGLGWHSTREEARKLIAAATREQLKTDLKGEGYRSVLIAFLLLTVAGAALSWLVQRVLDHFFPDHKRGAIDPEFARRIAGWSAGEES